MSSKVVDWTSAVDHVSELPTSGNQIGDCRMVVSPPGGLPPTPYTWDGTNWISAREGQSGTVRLYVDGTNGDDSADGTSWATAWKTYTRLHAGIAALFSSHPLDLACIIYVRGDFATHANRLLDVDVDLYGNSNIYVIHHPNDMTVIGSGTLATIAATSLAHGLREITLNGYTPTASDRGRLIRFSGGAGEIWWSQILRVNGTTLTILRRSAVPSWVVGGGTVLVDVLDASMTGTSELRVSIRRPARDDAWSLWPGPMIFGIVADAVTVCNSTHCSFAVCEPATGTRIVAEGARTYGYVTTQIVPTALAQEFGLIGTNTSDYSKIGNSAYRGSSSSLGIYSSAAGLYAGVFRSVSCLSGDYNTITESAVDYVTHGNPINHLDLQYCIVTGQAASTTGAVLIQRACSVSLNKVSFVDLPAAGVTGGLVYMDREADCYIHGAVDGNNTGTAGSGLYGFRLGNLSRLAAGTVPTIQGKHGDYYLEDTATVRFAGALSIGAREGGGPDIYVGPNSTVHFAGNVTKTATNPSGGGTANSVIRCRRGAKVTQASGSSFTLPAGSGSNLTDYGANGAIDAESGCEVILGTLAGGNAVATNTAVRLKKGSRLLHAGGAPSWGAAALDLGGAAPQAMPAAVTSDLAAGTPEDCWVMPGVA